MKVRSRGNTPEERNLPPKEDLHTNNLNINRQISVPVKAIEARQPRFEESFHGNSSLRPNSNNDSLQPTSVAKENSRSKTRIHRLYDDYERDVQDFENI